MSSRKCTPVGEVTQEDVRRALRAGLDVIEREIELVEAEWSKATSLTDVEWCVEQLRKLHELAEPNRLALFRTTEFLHRSVKK